MTSARSIPESLSSPGLRPLWELSRRRPDRYGLAARGRITRPDLDQSSELTLESLLGHGLTKRIDLAELETALLALDVGEDLCDALTPLGSLLLQQLFGAEPRGRDRGQLERLWIALWRPGESRGHRDGLILWSGQGS